MDIQIIRDELLQVKDSIGKLWETYYKKMPDDEKSQVEEKLVELFCSVEKIALKYKFHIIGGGDVEYELSALKGKDEEIIRLFKNYYDEELFNSLKYFVEEIKKKEFPGSSNLFKELSDVSNMGNLLSNSKVVDIICVFRAKLISIMAVCNKISFYEQVDTCYYALKYVSDDFLCRIGSALKSQEIQGVKNLILQFIKEKICLDDYLNELN